jgi:HD-GYP domain-containing protein (c-di-GMP phosphodiesterase class II)
VETFKLAATIHDCFQCIIYGYGARDELWEEKFQMPYLIAELTEKFDFFADEREVLLAHCEHYDGSGYPLGLEKDQIPVGARIFSIVEAFVTLSLELENALMDDAVLSLAEKAGKDFDPHLLLVFFKALRACEPHKINRETFTKAEKMIESLLK